MNTAGAPFIAEKELHERRLQSSLSCGMKFEPFFKGFEFWRCK